jgi:hypothetical protein
MAKSVARTCQIHLGLFAAHTRFIEGRPVVAITETRSLKPGHSCAALMHLCQVPTAVMAAWLGHASAAFTMSVYAHSQDDALKAAASSFGNSFGRLATTRDTETGSEG